MDKLKAFDTVMDEMRQRLAAVGDDQWELSTPCEEWNVRQLCVHIVGHNPEITAMVTGQPASEMDPHTDDLVGEWDRTAKPLFDAFHRPGAMGGTVHHPSGEMPLSRYIDMRIGGYLVHAWDVARSIGASEDFDPDVLEISYAFYAPRLGQRGNGRLGAAPTAIAEDAPLLHKVLLLAGRQP